jgi:EAL domain-containing protein (putative c-di-GMP-specific phosphodiesterase class I)/FixJ family two-component response regulator
MSKESQHRSVAFAMPPEMYGTKLDCDAPARASPLCYIVDDERGICHMISHAMRAEGFTTTEFRCAPSLLEAVAKSAPDIIFLDLSLEGSDAVDAIRGLDLLGYGGAVQLISGREKKLLNNINDIGQRRSLHMLPVLPKPFDLDAIRKLIKDVAASRFTASRVCKNNKQNLSREFDLAEQAKSTPSVRLDEALANDWLEFWYQPIIDIRGGSPKGAELLARVRHPKYGVLNPAAFLPSADLTVLLALTERALIESCLGWQVLAKIGIPLRLAINVPVKVLTTLAIPELVREHRPKDATWPGLILEVTEDQIISDIALAYEVATQLCLYDVSISIDDFGAGYSSLARLQEMPFCELKIDREFVTNCACDEVKAGICQTIIDLAHRFGKVAVAEGIENDDDLRTLRRMGCDMGQGYLIGRPMPKDYFLTLLRQRSRNAAVG